MGLDFSLTFHTVAHLNNELTKLNCCAHAYKIGVSRAFCRP